MDCQVKDRDSRLNSKRKRNNKQAWHEAERGRKTIQLVNIAAVHELDEVSSDKDTSQWSQQIGSM
jgi:hypothetical protein